MLRTALLLGLTVLILCGTSALAATKSEIDTLDGQMGQLWQQKRYKDVIPVALKLYRLTSDPRLLANIGRCYDLLNQDILALRYYRQYLRLAKASSRRTVVEGRVGQRRLSRRRAGTSNPLGAVGTPSGEKRPVTISS